jgi:hypothetical protein
MTANKRLRRPWAAAGMLFICAVANSCGDTKQSGKLEVRLDPQPVVWLNEAKREKLTPGSGEVIRVSGVFYNGTAGPLRGLTVSRKSCGCFQVEIGAEELQQGESAACTVFVPAAPAIGNTIEFTISGNVEGGAREEGIEATGKLKAYLIPLCHTRVTDIVFHSTDGMMSGETILISRYTKGLEDAGEPSLQLANGPDWLSISQVSRIGQRKILDGVVVTEYRIELAPDLSAIPGKDRSTELEAGTFNLRCGDEIGTTLALRYRVVRHDPYFDPSTVIFDETTVGKRKDRIVTLVGTATDQLRLKCTPECVSAELKTVDRNGGERSRPQDTAIPIQISFAPTVDGSIKGEVVVERSSDGKALAVLNVRGKGIHAEK